VPNLSPQDQRHNLILNCLHEFSWGFGVAFHTVYAVIPLFLKQLGAPTGVSTSVAGLFYILIAIPQLFTATVGRNIRNIKLAAISVHTLVLPPIFIAGFTFAFLTPLGPKAWMLYYACFILYGLAVGIIIPIWTGFLHHAISAENRGTFFGLSFAFNSVGGFVGGFLLKRLLNSSLPFPNNFGWGFLIMTASITFGILLFFGYRLYEPEEQQPHKSLKQFWVETKSILRQHTNFRRYLFSRIFFTANYPAISLYAIYTQEKFGFNISEVGIFTILNVLAFGLASLAAGKLGDRKGHKLSLILAFTAHLLAVITALTARSMTGVYAIFVLIGLGQGAFMPASMNLVYDFAGNRDNKTYIALIDTVLAPFTFLAIMLVGKLSGVIATETLFLAMGTSIFVGLFFMITLVHDPKKLHRASPFIPPVEG
jgi:MFS family permease